MSSVFHRPQIQSDRSWYLHMPPLQQRASLGRLGCYVSSLTLFSMSSPSPCLFRPSCIYLNSSSVLQSCPWPIFLTASGFQYLCPILAGVHVLSSLPGLSELPWPSSAEVRLICRCLPFISKSHGGVCDLSGAGRKRSVLCTQCAGLVSYLWLFSFPSNTTACHCVYCCLLMLKN